MLLVGRNPDKCADTVEQIRAQTGNRQVEALRADLSSQEKIRELARQVQERSPHLDVLINNAAACG